MARFKYHKLKIYLVSVFSLLFIIINSPTVLGNQVDDWRWDNIPKIVVVPDIHGAYPAFIQLLQKTNLVDTSLGWIGGDTHLVSLGDLLDRGPESRKTMDLLIRLQQEAQSAGGYVHVVAGNHELMNLIGDLRYVSKEEYEAFTSEETAPMRELAFQKFLSAPPQPFVSEQAARIAFDKKFPRGYLAHRKAFSVDGFYGRWLLSLPAIVVINEIAFVHAGLPEMVANNSLEFINHNLQTVTTRYMQLWHELVSLDILPDDDAQDPSNLARSILQNALPTKCINSRKKSCMQLQKNGASLISKDNQNKLNEFINLSNNPIIGIDGPLWNRGAVYCRSIYETPILNASMDKLGVKQVVVGHTTTPDSRAHNMHNNTLTLLDTGMLVKHYKGRPAAMVMQDGQQLVHYLNPYEQLAPKSGEYPNAYKLSTAELKNTLQNGTITVLNKPIGAKLGVGGVWKVQIQHNNNTIQGLFYPSDRINQDKKELAAHALDKLLGFDLIPLTVERNIENTNGALQVDFPYSLNEKTRLEKNSSIGGWCPIPRQYELMHTWDILTENTGRTVDNLNYRTNLGLIYLTEHNSAFGTNKRLPKKLSKQALKINPEIRQSLASLNKENLQEALGENIDKKAIEALLSRRDALLKSF